MVEKLVNIIINEVNKHNIEKSCLLASFMFNQSIPDSEIVKGFLIRGNIIFYMFGLDTKTKYMILPMSKI